MTTISLLLLQYKLKFNRIVRCIHQKSILFYNWFKKILKDINIFRKINGTIIDPLFAKIFCEYAYPYYNTGWEVYGTYKAITIQGLISFIN